MTYYNSQYICIGLVLFEDEYFDGDEIQKKLTNIIARFTEKQRRVFQMKYFDDLSFRKISEILEVSEGTSKSNLFKAKKKLRKDIKELLEAKYAS